MLALNNIHIAYDGNLVVKGVDLTLNTGEIGCLLGPSGCGKTSVLRAIAGFEPLQQGSIALHQKHVSDARHVVAPENRNVAIMFQDFALFPHMTVAQNVGFGLHAMSATDKQQRIDQMLTLVGLTGRGQDYPHQLSGGQQQRVALARAMAPKPDLLLLDEPFSSLDAELREELAGDIRTILKQESATALMVTHDQHEAFAMADSIGVLEGGKLHQWDSAYGLYHNPASRFVADFIGSGVFLKGQVGAEGRLATALGDLPLPPEHRLSPGQTCELLVRPDDILHDDASAHKALVKSRAFKGSHILYELRLQSGHGQTVLCLATSHHDHQVGETFGIRLDLEHLVVFA